MMIILGLGPCVDSIIKRLGECHIGMAYMILCFNPKYHVRRSTIDLMVEFFADMDVPARPCCWLLSYIEISYKLLCLTICNKYQKSIL
jgi:hypothetical protein